MTRRVVFSKFAPSVAGLALSVCGAGGLTWLLAHEFLEQNETERALLETERTAAQMHASLLTMLVTEKETKELQEHVTVPLKESSSPSLWGLKKWPRVGEIFLAARGKLFFLVQQDATSRLHFYSIQPQQILTESIGSLIHSEWLIADTPASDAVSIATVESSEAQTKGSKRNFTVSTAMVPNSNTVLRRYFLRSQVGFFKDPLWWVWGISFALCAALGAIVTWGIMRNSYKDASDANSSQSAEHTSHPNSSNRSNSPEACAEPTRNTVVEREEFLSTLRLSFENNLIEYQCVTLFSPDVGSLSPQQTERALHSLTTTISAELNRVFQHDFLPARIDTGLLGIHFANKSAHQTMEFMASLTQRLSMQCAPLENGSLVTFSVAVAEFHRHANEPLKNSEATLSRVLNELFTALKEVKEHGGNGVVLVGKVHEPQHGGAS
jgi:hypothetical protein